MRLTAVVSLVVEDMQERRTKRLCDLLRTGDGAISDAPGETRIVEPVHEADDAAVLGLALGAQRGKVIIGDCVEGRVGRSLAG